MNEYYYTVCSFDCGAFSIFPSWLARRYLVHNWCNRRCIRGAFDILLKHCSIFSTWSCGNPSVRSSKWTKLKRKEEKCKEEGKPFFRFNSSRFFAPQWHKLNAIQNYEWFGSMHISKTNIKCICSFVAHFFLDLVYL